MTKQEFIDTIGKLARNENAERTSHVLPSICVAQACLESGYGQSLTMMKYNAPFGIKATKSWKGAAYNSRTGEYYATGYTEITAAFRAYPDLAKAVSDYYNLITTSGYYTDVVNQSDVNLAVSGLKAYATDPNYTSKVLSVINNNNLRKFDYPVHDKVHVTEIETYVGWSVIINPDIIEGGKKYVLDKNNVKNRLWYDVYTIMKESSENVLIGKDGVFTCWINKNKIKEVSKKC